MFNPHGLVVGDDVSYGFNGDWYPCGKVERFSPSGKFMFTDKGGKFVRHVTNSGTRYNIETGKHETEYVERYYAVGGTWCIAKGIHREQNPHF